MKHRMTYWINYAAYNLKFLVFKTKAGTVSLTASKAILNAG